MWSLSYTWFKPRYWPWVLCITRSWGLWHIVLPFKTRFLTMVKAMQLKLCHKLLPCGLESYLCCAKSHSCPLSVNGHPGDRVHAWEPCAKCSWSPWAGEGPSELQKYYGREQNWLSVLAAPGKSRKQEQGCTQQLEGRLIFPFKLGNHFLAAAVTARVSSRSG